MTSKIEKDLISNKSSCYIFDIDNCLADADHLILTKQQAYEKDLAKYNEDLAKYEQDMKEYEIAKESYKQGNILMLPDQPIEPMKPIEPEVKVKDKYAAEYFHKHLKECYPINGILDLFLSLALTKKVILLTGRNELDRADTIDWLRQVIIERTNEDTYRRINFQLICRPSKYDKSNAIFKKEKVLELTKQYHIQLIIEDHPEIVEEYTKLGFLVLKPNRETKEIL